MILFPNAKINVGLWVVNKRDDGFHDIETLFLPIGLNDVLEFVEKKGSSPALTVSGDMPECPVAENLVYRAWQMMHEQYKIPAVEIHLHKIIPTGAGLGGGSSDAAFMLKGLSEHFELGCQPGELEEFAAQLGSDCAFFIQNKPAIGKGRGEILEPVQPDLEDYEILLVNPGVHISTTDAYQGVQPATASAVLRELLLFPVNEWQVRIRNDFEPHIFRLYPEIEAIRDRLTDMGAVYAAMSGSGSTVFGIFRKNGRSLDLRSDFPEYFTWSGDIL